LAAAQVPAQLVKGLPSARRASLGVRDEASNRPRALVAFTREGFIHSSLLWGMSEQQWSGFGGWGKSTFHPAGWKRLMLRRANSPWWFPTNCVPSPVEWREGWSKGTFTSCRLGWDSV
jgi:hypothetical protein